MSDEPLHTTTFTLTRADALAYEQAAARMTPLGVFALIFWLGLWGASALLIPQDWAGPRLGWIFNLVVSILVAIGYVLVLLLISVRQWLAARRRLRRPLEVTLSEWPDRLELIGVGMPQIIAFGDIRRTISGREHLFIETEQDILIVPSKAFAEEGSLDEMARRIAATPHPTASPLVDPDPPRA